MDLVTHLHEQLDLHWRSQARPRLEGLGDEEYLWEPAPGAWSLRPADDPAPETSTHRVGRPWSVDFAFPPPEPAPVTTIAWRLAHVTVGCLAARTASHFTWEGPAPDYATWPYAPTAAEALEQLDDAYRQWSQGVRSLTPEQLAVPVGPAEGPWAAEPMITLVLHINREVIHHLAEVALIRDLWCHRGA